MNKVNQVLGWDIDEIKELITCVNCRGEESLLQRFEKFSLKTGRKTYSVRNFYYDLIKHSQQHEWVYVLLQKNNLTQYLNTNHFSKTETNELMYQLLKYNDGKSVRQICANLAQGNQKQMARFQNKYRNTIKNDKTLVNSILDDLRSKNIPVRNIRGDDDKILLMNEKSALTDEELISLFKGLVNLVKQTAKSQAEQQEIKNNQVLKQSIIASKRKDMLIRELKEQNDVLRAKLDIANLNLENYNKKVGKILPNELKQNGIDIIRQYFSSLRSVQSQRNKK